MLIYFCADANASHSCLPPKAGAAPPFNFKTFPDVLPTHYLGYFMSPLTGKNNDSRSINSTITGTYAHDI
jgi:hypothetical protein